MDDVTMYVASQAVHEADGLTNTNFINQVNSMVSCSPQVYLLADLSAQPSEMNLG